MTILELLKEKLPSEFIYGISRDYQVKVALIAKRAGLSRPTIYEASRRGSITSETVDKIIAATFDDNGNPSLTREDFTPYLHLR